MARESATDAMRRFVREHERGLIVAWLSFMLLVLGVGFVWGIVFRGAERAVDAYEARWPARVDHGEQLLASGQAQAAADFLEPLDAQFPAQSVKHRFDRERERLLTALAHSYVALDKKQRALAACERLVAFDPRNWQNHYTQAEVALAFHDGDLAKLALDRVLAIHPAHLPSVEARIKLAFDGGLYAQIPPLWRAYLAAFRLAQIEFTLGDSRVALELPSDGLAHRFVQPCAAPADFRGSARFATRGWSIDVRDLVLCAAARSGVEGAPQFAAPQHGPWEASDARAVGTDGLAATGVNSSLQCELSVPAEGCAQAAFELVAYKACTPSLWEMIETSYRNLLLWDELAATRARTRIGGCLEAGSLYED